MSCPIMITSIKPAAKIILGRVTIYTNSAMVNPISTTLNATLNRKSLKAIFIKHELMITNVY